MPNAYPGRMSFAVDGIYQPDDASKVATTHTAAIRPWIEVDLGQIRNIVAVKIFSRTDCCPGKIGKQFFRHT